MRISDWSSDVCSSDLFTLVIGQGFKQGFGLFVRQMPHPNLAALAISLERRYLVDPLPFALGLAEDGANERHISVPRGVRRFGQAGRQQPVDHIPAHPARSEEQPSEHQSLMRNLFSAFRLKTQK